MKYIPIANVDNIYNCAENYKIHWHPVNNSEFQNFCFALKRFEHILGDECNNDYWKYFLRKMRRYRFEISSTPIPFNHPSLIPIENLNALSGHLDGCEKIYPEFTQTSKELLNHLKNISQSNDNPMLENIINICNKNIGHKQVGLLLISSGKIPLVEKILSLKVHKSKFDLIGIHSLNGGVCYEQIIIVGSSRWFPEHIVNSPRAPEIHVLHYSWIKDGIIIKPSFVVSTGHEEMNLTSHPETKETFRNEEYLEPHDILPRIIWDEIAVRLTKNTTGDLDVDNVDARLFLLEGDSVVFLEAAENAKVLVIDLEEDTGEAGNSVKRIPVTSITPGVFVLLRTAGGGDYIVQVADRILGNIAIQAREMQVRWKKKLRQAVNSAGVEKTCKTLQVLGSTLANEANLRNWMSGRNIRPQNYNDFLSIMRLIGFESDATLYWKTATVIDTAHRQAGFQLRRLLLRRVLNMDLSKLEKLGRFDFELDEADGGILTAFRVENISPDIYTIPASKVGHPFEREELWQE